MSVFSNRLNAPQHTLTQIARALVLLAATQAMAQSVTREEGPAATSLPSVVVTSGRLQQQQLDAPAAIYHIGAEQIQNAGVQANLADTLGTVPGVMAVSRGSNYAQDNMISIRGFGAHVAVGFGGVRLMSDGIPAITPDGQGQSTAVNLSTVDRIEVLKGPLGQLYGNASGGVIQTFTREAGNGPELSEKLATGSFGLRRTDTFMSDRVGNTGIVADYNTLVSQGYRVQSSAQREQFNSVVTTQLQEDSRLKVILNSFKNIAQDPTGLTLAQWRANPAQAGNNTIVDNSSKTTQQTQIGFVFDQRLSADLNMSARYYDGVRSNMQDQATSSSTGTASQSVQSTFNGTWTGLDRKYGGLGVSMDGKNKLNSDVRMDWVAGLETDYANENRQQGCTTSGNFVISTSTCNHTPPTTSNGLTRNELDQSYARNYYGQANWHFGDQYTLVTGVRKTDVTLLSTSYVSGYTSGQVNYAATTPVVGLTWHAFEDLNVYYNNGQGFETPTLLQAAYTQSSPTALVPKFNTGLRPNTSHQQEVGTKWTPSPTSQLNADIFQISTNDELVIAVSSSGQTAYTNAGGTLRKGIELGWKEQWSPNWRSVANATAMQATYTSNAYVASGNQLAGLPNQQLYANLQWSQNGFARAAQTRVQGLNASVDWVARSHMWADDANSAYVAGYGIFNVQVRENFDFKGINWEAFAMINNVGNQNYVGSAIINQSSKQYYESGMPRNWIAGLQGQLKF